RTSSAVRAREDRSVGLVEGEGRRAGRGAGGLGAPRARNRNDGRRELEQRCERDLRRRRTAHVCNVGQCLLASEAARAARPAERGVRDQRDSPLLATLDETSSEGTVVIWTERDLDGRDRSELERLVQLSAVDVRDPDA